MRIPPSLLALPAAALLGYAMLSLAAPVSAEAPVQAPAPLVDPAPAAPKLETAIFAGGCFWGVQGVFAHVSGVKSAVSGYTGGSEASAKYAAVGTGQTGHAESVRVVFDPAKVSYGTLLRVFFSVVADPTTLNAQGPDRGSQYRSALFPTNERQRQVATAYLAQLRAARLWDRPIVTAIERAGAFYPAEGYHQDYLFRNPDAAYIRINDLPKVAALKQFYPKLYRAQPSRVKA